MVEVGIFFLQLSKVGLLTNAVKNDCNYNACYPFSDAFKISVEILVKLLKAKPQSSLQDKFCARSRATGKTDGYSFAVPSSANG